MKTYSAKTNALAADAVLTAAVEEARRLIVEGDCDYVDQPEDLLDAAGWVAELLLERAR